MSTITSVVVIPSTPLVLTGHPGTRHRLIETVSGQIDRAVEELAGSDTIVILAGGPVGSGIRVRTDHDVGAVDRMRRGYGLAPSSERVPPAPAGTRRGPGDRIAAAARVLRRRLATTHASTGGWADSEVLASHAARAAPGATLVMVSIAPDISVADASEIAGAITATDDQARTGVLVAGDLSAGHGTKPPRPGATIVLDDQVLGALDGSQPDRLLRVSEELALGSHSRAIGALRVLGAVLADAAVGTVVRWSGAPLGVGYVVAVGR